MSDVKELVRKVIPLRTSTFGKAKGEIISRLDTLLEIVNRIELLLTELQSETRSGFRSTGSGISRLSNDTREIIFAESLRSATNGCTWLEGASFSPGRWAVGYQYLYVLFHALNEMNPKRILDLGLGQTTNMISRYALSHEGVAHDVVEHDENWIRFYSTEQGISDSTNIIKLDLTMEEREGCTAPIRVYDGFHEAIGNKQYDLISIDAPFGGDMNELARIDVLKMMPAILADSFVVMLDDYNRVGEQHTAQLMRETLDAAGIDYCEGTYQGTKRMVVFTSPDNSFLTSL